MPELWKISEDEYGSEYRNHLLEQYKLYVEMADRVSQRRTTVNNYLLTVNAFLVTLYGLSSSLTNISCRGLWAYLVPVAGIIVSLAWLAIIRSHRDLNTGKFKVIHELEKRLPSALYDYEWELLEEGRGKAYRPISHIDMIIPWVFTGLYVLLAVLSIFN